MEIEINGLKYIKIYRGEDDCTLEVPDGAEGEYPEWLIYDGYLYEVPNLFTFYMQIGKIEDLRADYRLEIENYVRSQTSDDTIIKMAMEKFDNMTFEEIFNNKS